MKIQFLLLAVAAFGSLQVEAFGSLPPYKPPPRTIPHCDSPAHTGKPGSRCYRNRYDVEEDFVGHMTDEDDDEYVGNAWNRGWLRHYCAGGPGPGQMAEWLRYCKMAAGADKMEEEDESVGGWVKVAGGLIWKDIDRGVANGECNGRCQRRLRAASRSRRLKKKAYLNKMLISAVKNGNIRKVKRLLSQGADVNAYVKDGENEDKKTALLTAIQYSPKGDVKVAMVKLLLKSGANPNKRSSKWRHSALELSVWYDLFAETSKLLLADPRTNPNLEDYQGKTALSIAISNGMQTHAALIMRDPRTRV